MSSPAANPKVDQARKNTIRYRYSYGTDAATATADNIDELGEDDTGTIISYTVEAAQANGPITASRNVATDTLIRNCKAMTQIIRVGRYNAPDLVIKAPLYRTLAIDMPLFARAVAEEKFKFETAARKKHENEVEALNAKIVALQAQLDEQKNVEKTIVLASDRYSRDIEHWTVRARMETPHATEQNSSSSSSENEDALGESADDSSIGSNDNASSPLKRLSQNKDPRSKRQRRPKMKESDNESSAQGSPTGVTPGIVFSLVG